MTHSHQPRLSVWKVEPGAYKAVSTMEQYCRQRIDSQLYHLIKLRASILNGCAFCVDMHSTEGIGEGMDSRKLFGVAAWADAPFFDERERAALALTDEVTRIGEHGVSDPVWEDAIKHWGEEGVADLLMGIATINVWNRISIATRTQPPPLQA